MITIHSAENDILCNLNSRLYLFRTLSLTHRKSVIYSIPLICLISLQCNGIITTRS